MRCFVENIYIIDDFLRIIRAAERLDREQLQSIKKEIGSLDICTSSEFIFFTPASTLAASVDVLLDKENWGRKIAAVNLLVEMGTRIKYVVAGYTFSLSQLKSLRNGNDPNIELEKQIEAVQRQLDFLKPKLDKEQYFLSLAIGYYCAGDKDWAQEQQRELSCLEKKLQFKIYIFLQQEDKIFDNTYHDILSEEIQWSILHIARTGNIALIENILNSYLERESKAITLLKKYENSPFLKNWANSNPLEKIQLLGTLEITESPNETHISYKEIYFFKRLYGYFLAGLGWRGKFNASYFKTDEDKSYPILIRCCFYLFERSIEENTTLQLVYAIRYLRMEKDLQFNKIILSLSKKQDLNLMQLLTNLSELSHHLINPKEIYHVFSKIIEHQSLNGHFFIADQILEEQKNKSESFSIVIKLGNYLHKNSMEKKNTILRIILAVGYIVNKDFEKFKQIICSFSEDKTLNLATILTQLRCIKKRVLFVYSRIIEYQILNNNFHLLNQLILKRSEEKEYDNDTPIFYNKEEYFFLNTHRIIRTLIFNRNIGILKRLDSSLNLDRSYIVEMLALHGLVKEVENFISNNPGNLKIIQAAMQGFFRAAMVKRADSIKKCNTINMEDDLYKEANQLLEKNVWDLYIRFGILPLTSKKIKTIDQCIPYYQLLQNPEQKDEIFPLDQENQFDAVIIKQFEMFGYGLKNNQKWFSDYYVQENDICSIYINNKWMDDPGSCESSVVDYFFRGFSQSKYSEQLFDICEAFDTKINQTKTVEDYKDVAMVRSYFSVGNELHYTLYDKSCSFSTYKDQALFSALMKSGNWYCFLSDDPLQEIKQALAHGLFHALISYLDKCSKTIHEKARNMEQYLIQRTLVHKRHDLKQTIFYNIDELIKIAVYSGQINSLIYLLTLVSLKYNKYANGINLIFRTALWQKIFLTVLNAMEQEGKRYFNCPLAKERFLVELFLGLNDPTDNKRLKHGQQICTYFRTLKSDAHKLIPTVKISDKIATVMLKFDLNFNQARVWIHSPALRKFFSLKKWSDIPFADFTYDFTFFSEQKKCDEQIRRTLNKDVSLSILKYCCNSEISYADLKDLCKKMSKVFREELQEKTNQNKCLIA